MPLYDYLCTCGNSQQLLRPIAARDDAVDCERCGGGAARAIAAPRLAVLTANNRRAHERNERSAHEPRRYSRPPPSEPVAPRKQPVACGHAHPQGRPWMLGH
jgi:putative FmdB family regulatory protein